MVYMLSKVKESKQAIMTEQQKKQKKQKQEPCITTQVLLPTTTTTCVVCFETIKAEEGRYDLECGHSFHNGCITNWYKSKAGSGFLQIPYEDMKHLLFFSNGENCFCCPTCRVEYTKELEVTDKCKVRQRDTTVKKILGKINILDFQGRGGRFTVATHYVTDPKTFRYFEPIMEMDDEDSNSTITLYKRK